jgi:hypothetical protein
MLLFKTQAMDFVSDYNLLLFSFLYLFVDGTIATSALNQLFDFKFSQIGHLDFLTGERSAHLFKHLLDIGAVFDQLVFHAKLEIEESLLFTLLHLNFFLQLGLSFHFGIAACLPVGVPISLSPRAALVEESECL